MFMFALTRTCRSSSAAAVCVAHLLRARLVMLCEVSCVNQSLYGRVLRYVRVCRGDTEVHLRLVRLKAAMSGARYPCISFTFAGLTGCWQGAGY